MPRRPRRTLSATYFHVINRSVRKARIFRNRGDYRAFLTVLQEGLVRHPMKLVSYCVMSNHWHLVMGPDDPETLTALMHWVTATHAIHWHRHHQTVGQGPVYQGRFRAEPIEAAADLVRVCRYVERNALRAGLVRRAQDWPWCSLAERLRPDPILPLSPAAFLSSNAWISYVNGATTATELIEERIRLASTPGTEAPDSVENSPVPLRHAAQDPGGFAEIFEDAKDTLGVHRATDENQADPHVEGPKHLRVAKAAGLLKPAEQRRNRPALAID